MTIRTNIGEPIGKMGKTKALALALLVLAAMAAMVLAPTQEARASAFPGANGKIVFASDRTTGTGVNNPEGDLEIFSMDPNGTALKQLTKNKATDAGASYSSDGKKIIFQSVRTGNFEVFSMNSDGTGQKDLTNDPSSDLRPSFFPDGKKIVFDSDRDGNRDVMVRNADGTGQTNLTANDPQRDENATFSPKSDEIAFVSDRGIGDSEIFVMNPDGTGQTALTANDFTDDDPSFSPDGNKIAFSSNRDGQGDFQDFDIFVMDSGGTAPVRLTGSRARDDQPAYSPDGKKLAFVSTRDGGDQDVFVMDATSGANQTDITPNTDFDSTPDWQPVAATFTVTTNTDPRPEVCDGTCSLREAIIASNDVPGQIPNNIKFDIPGSGVHTITPALPALPQITRPVVIDGYTQPGASPNTLTTGTNAALKIELNGINVPGNPGLSIAGSSHSVIRGLVINRFAEAISISDFDGTAVTADTRIEGNFLGTDPSGTSAPGNDVGVSLFSTDGNVVGGTTPAARNLISGNTDGIEFVGVSGTKVLGNLIGTTAGGSAPLGNDFYGVASFSIDSNNKIGDGTSGGANTIAFNGRDGIQFDQNESSTGNRISRNSIFSNAGLGIDLKGAGETDTTNVSTPNDPGDLDSGPNGLQNKPVLSAAKSNATSTTVTGNLNSTPNKTYVLQFFSNPSGNEGKKFMGQKSVTTGGSGNVSFTFSPASKVAVGQTITATATKSSTGDTSEFSAPRTVASS